MVLPVIGLRTMRVRVWENLVRADTSIGSTLLFLKKQSPGFPYGIGQWVIAVSG